MSTAPSSFARAARDVRAASALLEVALMLPDRPELRNIEAVTVIRSVLESALRELSAMSAEVQS